MFSTKYSSSDTLSRLEAVDAVAVGADFCHLEALLGAQRRDLSPRRKAHGRIYVRQDILDTFKTLKA